MKNQCIGISKSERCPREAILYNKMVCKNHYYSYRNCLEKNKIFPVYNDDALKDMENYIRENPNNSIIRIRKTAFKKKPKKKYISDDASSVASWSGDEFASDKELESPVGSNSTDEEPEFPVGSNSQTVESWSGDNDEDDLSSAEFDFEDLVVIDDDDVIEYEEKIKEAMKKLSMALEILKG